MSIADWSIYTSARNKMREARRTLRDLRASQIKNSKTIDNMRKTQQANKQAWQSAMNNRQIARDTEINNAIIAANSKQDTAEAQRLMSEQSQYRMSASAEKARLEAYYDEVDKLAIEHWEQIGDRLEMEIDQAKNDEKQYTDLAESSKKSYEESLNSIFGKNNG